MKKKPIRFKYGSEKAITPAMAVKDLEKKNILVDEKQAKTILDFLYLLAENTVHQYFTEDD